MCEILSEPEETVQVGQEAGERRASIVTARLRNVPPRRRTKRHAKLEAVLQQPEQLDSAVQRVSSSTVPWHLASDSSNTVLWQGEVKASGAPALGEAATVPVLEPLDSL